MIRTPDDPLYFYDAQRDGPIMLDGQVYRTSVALMDAVPRSHFITDAAPPKPELAHRPSSFAMNATDAADIAKLRAARDAATANAWRDPAPATGTTATPARPSAPAFDASLSLDALRAQAEARLTTAWMNP